MFLMVRRGFVRTIAVYFYAHCYTFSSILACVLHHFARRFAPFYLAFSTKTHSILHQNALRLAPKRSAFSTKTQCILQQIAKKQVLVAVSLNKNSLCQYPQPAPFSTQTNPRENRFFGTRRAGGGQKRHS